MNFSKRNIAISILGGGLLTGCAEKQAPSPNIIFLLADDMRWDAMGSAGNKVIETPNLDQLAAQGIRFDNAFVTTSICCCSRASILTGQYVSTHEIWDFSTPLSDEALSKTYPVILRNAGYQTGFIGKYGIGNGTEKVSPEFDYFWATSHQPNYENTDENGNYIHYTDLVQNHIDEFLTSTSKDKPFCLSVSFKAPHVQDGDLRQFIFNPRYKELYNGVTMPAEPTNTLEEWEKFPDFFKENNEARKRWEIRFSNPEQFQNSVKGYYRLIKGIDDVLGNVTKKLNEMGMAENTIIVFSSDNGFYLGEHGLAGKWYGHEPSIRVPLIIYQPSQQKPAGQVVHEMALNVDLAPTILSLAGIGAPESMDGHDLMSIVSGNKPDNWRTSFYYEHMVPIETIPKSQGLRASNYMYIVYPESKPVYEELYDLKNDPDQLVNLAIMPDQKMLLDSLRNAFRQSQSNIVN